VPLIKYFSPITSLISALKFLLIMIHTWRLVAPSLSLFGWNEQPKSHLV
jgi:hypothetical protein